jgi:hypothetical protein
MKATKAPTFRRICRFRRKGVGRAYPCSIYPRGVHAVTADTAMTPVLLTTALVARSAATECMRAHRERRLAQIMRDLG